MNPNRVSVLDIDTDIEGGKRAQVLDKLREVYGEDRVANVITFGTEKSKSAILTAARGLGIPVEDAQYISSLIPSDRGMLRTLKQCYYGDKENNWPPVNSFVKEMNEEPELWAVAQKIEGLVSRMGIHAGGIVFVDEPFTESTSLMRAPDGTIITGFDLHDDEKVSLIKIDLLSVEALDKIHTCLDLLIEDGLVKAETTLKETYENTIGVYKLERDNPDMWKMVWEHKIPQLFQMEQASGVQGIALTHPNNVEDLAHLNSIIRLMPQDRNSETPLEKYARFKNDIRHWYKEMDNYGLTKQEQAILRPYLEGSYGICETQELFMELVQVPELGGFDLTWSDRLRKSIAKKNPAEYEQLTKEYYIRVQEKELSPRLCDYVWRVLIATSRGYGFNASHTLSYSIIALQEMNLAFKYPVIYWNCACLITDSGASEEYDEAQSTNYDKIARAIGKMRMEGIDIVPVNINNSAFGFRPDAKNNRILFGLKALLNVNDDLVKEIIDKRPYVNIRDFYQRVQPKRQAMVSLIKAGAFDDMMERKIAMAWYMWEACDKKSRITLQNMSGLIKYNLLDLSTENRQFAFRVYEFNRYLKAYCKDGDNYKLDNRALEFLIKNELATNIIEESCINQKKWDKIYQSYMDYFREWIQENKEQILIDLNSAIFYEDWLKYAGAANYSAWEMEVLCYYYHEHELKNVNMGKYGLTYFYQLPEEPIVERRFYKGDKEIKMYKLSKICGTCIAKNNTKGTIVLLTTDGVVNVKFSKEYFSMFNKRVSALQPDGTKKTIEKGWFDRGNKLIVQGIRSEDNFIAKNYKSNTNGHRLYLITKVCDNGDIILQTERKKGELEEE